MQNLKDEFSEFFRFTIDALKVVQGRFHELSQANCTYGAFQQFVELVFLLPTPPARQQPSILKSYQTLNARAEAARLGVEQRWQAANDQDPISARGAWWGALNAVTAYVDHDLVTERDRYAYTMFGRGDEIKRKAYELALKSKG